MGVALLVEDLGFMFTLLGGTLGVLIPFGLPAMMLFSKNQGEVEVDVPWLRSERVRKVIGSALVLFSLFMLGLTLSDTSGGAE